MVEGQSVGYALTNDGTKLNSFYNTYLNAAYTNSTSGGAQANFTLTDSTTGTDYVSRDAFVNSGTGAPGHGSFNRTTNQNGPYYSFSYVPPSSYPTVISNVYWDVHDIVGNDAYADGSLNCYPFTIDEDITYMDEFTPGAGASVEIKGTQLGGTKGNLQMIFTGDPLKNYLGPGITNAARQRLSSTARLASKHSPRRSTMARVRHASSTRA